VAGVAIQGSVTIVTGASSGIGQAAARLFARSGAAVVLASRDEARLGALAAEIASYPAEALAVPTDVTSEVQVRALVQAALDRHGRIDILVCNAGVGLYGPVIDLPPETLRRAFDVNFFGVLHCIQAALPAMLSRRRGLIQIVSSVIARRSIPGYSGYCATKFALQALAESLRCELDRTGVTVQTVYPGSTDTDFPSNALVQNPSRLPGRLRPMSSEEVARHMIRAARSGRRDHFVTWSGRILALLNALAPGVLDAVVSHVMRPSPRQADDAVPDRRQ
jgi:short-subunit dehydrogenase